MRHHINEVVYAIGYNKAYDNGNRTKYGTFHKFQPFGTTTQCDVKVLRLTCVEHHAAAWTHDPQAQKKYDGFVFEADAGTCYYNQYPTADYGQISDAANGIVTCAIFDKQGGVQVFFTAERYLNEILHSIVDTQNEDDRVKLQAYFDLTVKRLNAVGAQISVVDCELMGSPHKQVVVK